MLNQHFPSFLQYKLKLNYANFSHTQLQMLFLNIQGTYFDYYTFYCYNKKWPNYLMPEGNSFLLLLNNTSMLFTNWEAIFLFQFLHLKVHFHTNIPYQLVILNDRAYKITTKSECIHLAFHKDLFRSKIQVYTWPMDFFSFLLVHKILLLFKDFYQLLYLLRKGCLQSIRYLEVILQVF